MLYPFTTRFLYAMSLVFVLGHTGYSQQPVNLVDARRSTQCNECAQVLSQMPKEVLFGIQVNADGNIYFSMNNKEWFNKIFTSDVDGVSADLVSKDLYACNKPLPGVNGFGKGRFLPPVYLPELKKNMVELGGGQFSVKIGSIPASLKGKELEGNLVILKRGVVCYYTFFTDIPRSAWDLLPMGLYADTLVNLRGAGDTTGNTAAFYTKKLQVTVPFQKGKTQFNAADLKPLYDSLKLTTYSIKSIDIRAYSSIEGAENVNTLLQQERAGSMVKALQHFQGPEIATQITSSENWIEFINDVKNTDYKELASLPKPDIKKRLLDKTVADKLEPILQHHRKAIVTIYLNKKTGLEKTNSDSLGIAFKNAIIAKNIARAGIIQETIFERVADGKLPDEYLKKLEIPKEAVFGDLQNNQVTYKLLLNITDEQEAIHDLKDIERYSPNNGRVKYNICALSFGLWKYDSSYVNSVNFKAYINSLTRYGIPEGLVKRMRINYEIIMSELYMARYDYAAKDRSLAYIKENYASIQLEDKDLLALAKYLCYYAMCDWATGLLEPRVGKIDVNEDLLFYYINLQLFYADKFQEPLTKTAVLNAIAINPKRFCRFFNAIGNGGSSFQLLDMPHLRGIYCESCSK